MVLNALKVDPNRTWKGVWRWYSEEVLHCSNADMMKNGMVLDQLTQLARCNSLHTMTFRPTLDDDDISSAATPPNETAKATPIKRSNFSKNTLIQLRKELTKSFAEKGLKTVEAKVKVGHIIKSLSDPVKAEKHLQMI